MTMNTPSIDTAPLNPDFRAAYELLKPEFGVIPEAEFAPLNADIANAAITIMGAMNALRTLKPAIAAELPKFPIASVDRVELMARATLQAQANYVLASTPPGSLAELEAKLLKLRARFMADLNALATRELIDDSKLSELKNPSGYKNVASAVMALVAHFRGAWSVIEGSTGLRLAELEEAQGLCESMFVMLGVRERGTPELIPATIARRQAFTLMVRTWAELRHAVTYLRRNHGDLEDFTPALFGFRKGKGPSQERDARDGDSTSATGAAAAPVSNAPPVQMQPVAGGSTAPGMPGNNPMGGG